MYDLLKGMRVVEGAAFIAGPSCGLHLAQMGAEVIRFDPIGGGFDYRRWPLADNGASFYWEGLNKGKKSIAIDLSSGEGRELALALATAPGANAGLFLTNYPVSSFLSYEKLSARRSDIICVRIMGWADGAPAVDYTVNAAAGLPYLTGPAASDAPVNHVLPAWDLLGGAYAAFAMIAAERARRESGKGADIRIPLSDLVAGSLGHMGFVAEALARGSDRGRMGNELYGAFGRDFTTADGERLMIVAITPRQWRGLVKALDLSDVMAELERELGVSLTQDEGARFTHRRRIADLVEKAVGERALAVLGPELDACGVTWSKYQTLHKAVTTDARMFTHNPIMERIAHPSGAHYPAPGAMATLAQEARAPVKAAPHLGQDTDQVLAEILGLTSAQIGDLHDRGVVAGASA